jgi:hypothetical protein
MVPSPQHRHIQQSANMLRDKSMLLKLENIIVFTTIFISYFKARRIVGVPGLCVFQLQMMETHDPNQLNQ